MGLIICEEMRGIYSSLRDLNLLEIGLLILMQLIHVLELILYFWCYPSEISFDEGVLVYLESKCSCPVSHYFIGE